MDAPSAGGKSSVNSYKIDIPIDASGVEGFKPEQQLKVLLVESNDTILASGVVKLDGQGKGAVSLGLSAKPKTLRAVIGPESADDNELLGMQTLNVAINTRRFIDAKDLRIPVIIIPPYYWHWWLRWCRTFTLRGRVVCPDGRPVPGAQVCAYDIDAWWWWVSKQRVGCATTNVDGSFEIKFRWCCGWFPWWWWRRRFWEFEPILANHIIPELQKIPLPHPIPLPDPVPDINVFKPLLGEDEFANLRLTPSVEQTKKFLTSAKGSTETAVRTPVEPSFLEAIREKLLKKIPTVPALERLRLWPWWPWHPWWDCTPDIIFRVTQDCGLPDTVIVEENVGDTRWDIPTTLDVTLVANEKACCLGGGDDPEGMCAVITNVCSDPINNIGGNAGLPTTPVGYQNPGIVATNGDRPYGGNVLIQGQVGTDVDYYRFVFSSDNGVTWNDMPASNVGDIPRMYYIPSTTTFVSVPFLTTIDGQLVFETRQHYEATHDPLEWNVTRFWMATNYLSLINWLTENPFLNGLYQLQMKGYTLVGGHLANEVVLPVCSTPGPTNLVLQIDNRIVGAGSGHPASTSGHMCGPGTVHSCTMEPDSNIVAVKIVHDNGTETNVESCSTTVINNADILQIDFFAYDPEGHLSFFTLDATYDVNLIMNILTRPGMTMAPLGGAPVPAAAQVGPTYADARAAGAVAPNWKGGAIRLRVPAHEVFPYTCCYQLELRAHKRTIVHCNHGLWNQTNYSEYSFMITV